ncbi:MAG: hypothetical protein HYS78_01825 [Parcubacteria group bacterium]|nr:hypothetical protein [Parcubacteria group bacterium]
MRYWLLGILALIVFVGFTEKTTRFVNDSRVFSAETVPVHYSWTSTEPWGSGLMDPVNVGAHRKWLGFKSYDAYIEILSRQAFSRGYPIRRESITEVSPLSEAVYECSNGFWTVTCVGLFRYRVDPERTTFQAGGYFIHPPSNWLVDTRQAKLTIYKYF